MPLAIELAAARVRSMSVSEIASRLDDRFTLLTGGSRTADTRQQTLRGTLDWSHDLLLLDERLLFRRLAVFADGCTAAAATTVCGGGEFGEIAVLDLITRLVDRSLVVAEVVTSGTRYRLLETVRQYAAEQLAAFADEERDIRDRHLMWCASLAPALAADLHTPQQDAALRHLRPGTRQLPPRPRMECGVPAS